jgi:hypothetical protein
MEALHFSYAGLFQQATDSDGGLRLRVAHPGPAVIACPTSGRPLRVATIEAGSSAICPACAVPGRGGYVSFEGDLRMAYACPSCRQLIWLPGA